MVSGYSIQEFIDQKNKDLLCPVTACFDRRWRDTGVSIHTCFSNSAAHLISSNSTRLLYLLLILMFLTLECNSYLTVQIFRCSFNRIISESIQQKQKQLNPQLNPKQVLCFGFDARCTSSGLCQGRSSQGLCQCWESEFKQKERVQSVS